jgi:hypothetical protein
MLHMADSQCEHCPIGGFYGWRSMDQHPQQSLLAGREDIHPHLEMRYSHVRPHVDYQNDSSSILQIYILYRVSIRIFCLNCARPRVFGEFMPFALAGHKSQSLIRLLIWTIFPWHSTLCFGFLLRTDTYLHQHNIIYAVHTVMLV